MDSLSLLAGLPMSVSYLIADGLTETFGPSMQVQNLTAGRSGLKSSGLCSFSCKCLYRIAVRGL